MKRALALILSLVMCVGLFTACGEQKAPDGNGDGESKDTTVCCTATVRASSS